MNRNTQPDTATNLPAATVQSVNHALLDLLFQNAMLSSAIIVAVASTLSWLQFAQADRSALIGWLIYMSCVAIGRYALSRVYHLATIVESTISIWRNRFRVGLAMSSLGWFATLFIFMPTDIAYQFATCMVLAGMAAGGVAILSADRFSFMMHTFGTVIAGGVYLFFSGQQLAIFFGILGLLVGVGLIRSALYMNRTLLDALNLANEKSRLVAEVTAANALIAENNKKLEAEIAERRRVETQLVTARDAAEVANRAKSTFLANMSHEIRTPLNGVIGFTELLGMTKLDAEQEYQLEHIKTSANALLDVISDVLDFSKIEAGRMEVHLREHKLRELLQPCAEIVRASAVQKSLALDVDIEVSADLVVRTDSVKLRQIILNFLGNAVKFTDRGAVLFSAKLLRDTVNPVQAKLQLSIRDTGIGMSEETLAKLFRPFSQADDSSTRRFGGTGLGLVIARELTELLGGQLTLTSKLGRGTTVTVTIPMAVVREV
jgi:signal transduction histidine kinase